ncbi:putative membrane protein [Kribbella sp. VKM Ac-2527]|uniref:Putative membrane protein n=1 Tax=Kribbella caucasensis TaxID=2512215 RepID=A0A4R6JED5_9ACTN|nr:YhgE/Pip family protein [Kribbella sp. VKM Ac-2527]TDO33972.1 putative membrane protein [Kribbella sp. VKM Ac-2527]
MFKPFANSARVPDAGPLTWRTWAGLIAVPILVMSLLTWAFWSPDTNHDTATAAVVNNDEPVKVNNQTIPLGRTLAGNLMKSEDSPYNWVLTDAADAEDGLADGKYAAVVTIPKDFSARTTSSATGKPLQASQAVVDVRTSSTTGVADPALATEIARTTQQSLDQQVVETYLDNVYVGFTNIHGQLVKAADGATELARGTKQLVPGAQQVATGSSKLSTAANQLSTGAKDLASGTSQLASGSSQLSKGLTQAERDTAQLPALTRQLATGAEQVAQGNQRIASTVVPLANRVIAALDALPSAKAEAVKFQRLSNQCTANGGTPQFCQQLAKASRDFTATAAKIDATKTKVRANAVQIRDSVQALATGSRKVANGNAQLAKQAVPLTRGIASAAQASRKLATGAAKVNTGAQQLSTGARQLSTGAAQLAKGSQQLSTGVVKVNTGTQQLATELNKGRNQVPTYTADERAHLKTIAADPSTAKIDSSSIGPMALTLFAALALWALALATYIVTRAVPDAVLIAREATWTIIARAALPGAAAAALAAAVITAIAVPVLGLGFVATLGFLAVALLAAFAFVSLNQAAAAIFGRSGRLASLAVLILAAATGAISTLPSPFYSLADYLPTHGAVLALRAVATDSPGLAGGIAELATWLVVGTLVSVLITDRRRYLSPRRLRPTAVLRGA